MYTVVNIPYSSLIGVISPRADERASLSLFRNIGAGVGLAPGAVILPLLVFDKVDEVKFLNGDKLLLCVIVLGLLSLPLALFTFKNVTERLSAPAQQKIDVKKSFAGFAKNKPFIILSFAALLMIGSQMYLQTINQYVFKDYFLEPEKFTFYSVAQYAPMLALMPIFNKLVARFGKKEICAAGALFAAISFAVLYIIHTDNMWMYLVLSFLGGVGMNFFVLAMWALVTDVIDYQEIITGQREDGLTYATFSFARKMGHTAAASGSMALLGVIGYVVSDGSQHITQTREVANGMYVVATLVPAIAFGLIFILLGLLYPLGKERVAELQAKLQAKRELSTEDSRNIV